MRSLIIAVAALAIGVIWLGSAFMNYNAVWTYGLSPTDAQFYSILSVAGDVIKAVAATIVLYALVKRLWLTSIIAMLFLAGTVLWSANSAIRYASSNVMGKFQQAKVNETLTKVRLKKLEIEKQQIEWLQKQTVSKYHKERKRMTTEINDARRSFDETIKALETSKRTTLDADPHYSLLSQMFGITESDAAKGTALLFAALIEFISGFGWFVLFSLFTPDPKPKKKGSTPLKETECIDVVAQKASTSDNDNVVQMQPKVTGQKTKKELLDQWFDQNVVVVSHPCIQATYAFKQFKESTGSQIPRNMFLSYMRSRLPEDKLKRVSKGLHYYIAIKEQGAQIAAVAA